MRVTDISTNLNGLLVSFVRPARGLQGVGVRPTGRHPHTAPPALAAPGRGRRGVHNPEGDPVSVSVTARRVAAAAAVAAALVGAAALPASATGHDHGRAPREHVVISAVQYDSPGRDDRSNRSLNKEWVDVTNNGRKSVNLDDWTLSDESGHSYTFHHYRLDGRATVRIHTGQGRDSHTDLYQDRRAYVWNNDHDTATLRNDRDRFVDDYSWDNRHRDHRGGDRHNIRH